MHAIVPASQNTVDASLTPGTACTYYSGVLTLWPYYASSSIGPLSNSTFGTIATFGYAGTAANGLTPQASSAVGVARLFGAATGAAVANTVYQRMAVLSCAMKCRTDLWTCSTSASPTATALAAQIAMLPTQHYFHPMGYKDAPYTAPSTCALNDSFFAQPDVSRKVAGRVSSSFAGSSGTPATTYAGMAPACSVRWSRNLYPHKLLNMGFDEYVSADSSFGTTAALPSNFTGVQLAGFSPAMAVSSGTSTIVGSMGYGTHTLDLVFTVLLKDFVGSLS
jgi:hypothetical protein